MAQRSPQRATGGVLAGASAEKSTSTLPLVRNVYFPRHAIWMAIAASLGDSHIHFVMISIEPSSKRLCENVALFCPRRTKRSRPTSFQRA